MSTLKEQLGKVVSELEANISVTPEQKTVIRNALCAIHTAELLLSELENADAIIKNCINNMTYDQRVQIAIDNHTDDLSAQWAFRSHDRKAMIERGQRYFGETA